MHKESVCNSTFFVHIIKKQTFYIFFYVENKTKKIYHG